MNVKLDPKLLKKNSEEVARLLKSVAHPKRLQMLCALTEGPKNVGELTQICGGAQSLVSQFLMRMRMEGLVEAKKEGQFVAYEIKDLRTLALMKSLFDIFCHSQTTKVLKAGGIEK